MNVFDIIGPIMIGPSSSHTAGAVRLGYIAHKVLGENAVKAEIELCGSFAQTYRGHGTDKALVAGILGMHGGGDACMYSTSPARPYEGVPIVLQGRQHGRSIEVLEIADPYGCYEQQMVSSPWKNFLRGIFCLVAAVGMAGIWWLVRSYPLRCFVFVVGCCLSLLGLAAGVLVWTQVTVHAEQASGWVAPLAVAVSLLGLVASLSGGSCFRK